jgi:hypothetical protein
MNTFRDKYNLLVDTSVHKNKKNKDKDTSDEDLPNIIFNEDMKKRKLEVERKDDEYYEREHKKRYK